jgi:hypothetical protein
MYVLYDDFGKLQLKNVANMVSDVMICKDTAENFDYSSNIDDETYNNIVLYYDPNSNSKSNSNSGSTSGSGSSSTQSSDVDKILNMARSQIGVKEDPPGSNNIKYNTAFYGKPVSGKEFAWCAAFVWWVFNQCGLSHLYNDNGK